jgi:hypothetical protein
MRRVFYSIFHGVLDITGNGRWERIAASGAIGGIN